jgi:hypothetical protein
VVIYALKEVMAVFERRYLKKIPLGLAVVTYVGFTPLKPWESLPGSSKPRIFDHIP